MNSILNQGNIELYTLNILGMTSVSENWKQSISHSYLFEIMYFLHLKLNLLITNDAFCPIFVVYEDPIFFFLTIIKPLYSRNQLDLNNLNVVVSSYIKPASPCHLPKYIY